MTGFCVRCGKGVRVRHTRGTRLADLLHAGCGGRLVGSVKVANAAKVPSYEVYRMEPEAVVAALRAAGVPDEGAPVPEGGLA